MKTTDRTINILKDTFNNPMTGMWIVAAILSIVFFSIATSTIIETIK